MSRGKSDKIVYKEYNQSQQWLLPPSLDELISLFGKKQWIGAFIFCVCPQIHSNFTIFCFFWRYSSHPIYTFIICPSSNKFRIF